MTNQDQTATASDDLPSSSGDTNNRQPKSPLHTAVTTPRGKYDALFGGEMNSAWKPACNFDPLTGEIGVQF